MWLPWHARHGRIEDIKTHEMLKVPSSKIALTPDHVTVLLRYRRQGGRLGTIPWSHELVVHTVRRGFSEMDVKREAGVVVVYVVQDLIIIK